MDRLKTFKWYFIIFASFFLVLWLLTEGVSWHPYKNLKYEIDFDSPALTISEAKGASNHGYIKGKITNDTSNIIDMGYIQFDFYDKEGTYLGTEFQELKNFNIGESNNVNINFDYNYQNVDAVKITIVDENKKREKDPFTNAVDVTIDTLNKMSPFLKILTVLFLVPIN